MVAMDVTASAMLAHTNRMCVECEDTEAAVRCVNCEDVYCVLCYEAQHHAGNRLKHTKQELVAAHLPPPPPSTTAPATQALTQPSPSSAAIAVDALGVSSDLQASSTLNPIPSTEPDAIMHVATAAPTARTDPELDEEVSDSDEDMPIGNVETPLLRDSAFIPLRLDENERALFTLLDASLNVSEYTDKVDVLSYRSPVKRVLQELSEIFSTLSGMMVATEFRRGKRLVENTKFEDNDEFFRQVFEIGRRFKIMNPERMRNNYGKMIYMLQDANSREIRNSLGFSCVGEIRTVKAFLVERHALDLLNDRRCVAATSVIDRGLSAVDQESAVRSKHQAIEELIRDYSSASLTAADIRLALASIDDSQSYLVSNRTPIVRMIEYLQEFFQPETIDKTFSLEIRAGRNGARLSHSHATQYEYVLQSLLLWRNVTTAMLKLWWAVETDLLEGNSYRLRDTGQGLNRVQHAPKTSNMVHRLLHQTQQLRPRWVGSSVVHLGDHNVPNALMFIDKYTQISRILSPIVNTVSEVEAMAANPATKAYVDEHGGAVTLQKIILCDFFKHGFDGSGADNFFDAGSCIDGRLTSAWNWCSTIEKKPFFHAFLMAGFVGFDGHFEK